MPAEDCHEPRTSDPVPTRRAHGVAGLRRRPSSGPRGRRAAPSLAPAVGRRHRHQPARGRARCVVDPALRQTGARGPGDAVRRLRSAGRSAGRRHRHHPHGRDGVRAVHARAGLHGRPRAGDDHEARLGFPDAIETVDKETSDTYTVSYTTAVLALAMLAKSSARTSWTTRRSAASPRPWPRRSPTRRSTRSPSRNGCSCSLARVRAPSRPGRARSRSGRRRASSRRATTRSTCCTARRCPRRP